MPRGKKPTKQKPEDIAWGGFIDLKLSEEDKALFYKWSEEFQWTFLEDVLADEMKVSFSYDENTDTYLCSLTSVKHAGSGMRCVLTARADDWQKAAALALFKHFVLLESDWGRFTPSNNGRRSEV